PVVRRLPLRTALRPRDGALRERGARADRDPRTRAGGRPRRRARPAVRPRDAATPATSVPLLEVPNLHVRFPIRTGLLQRGKRFFNAVDDVSFTVGERE